MASAAAARRAMQPGCTEQRKKRPEENISRRTVTLKSKMPEKQNEIRSPLMERSNRAPQKNTAPVKAMDLKMIKPTNKENVRLIENKDAKTMTFSQSFLKTKTLKERELKDAKQKEEPSKAEQKPAVKPVLGAYRGKIVQSKINSFRKPSETPAPEPKPNTAQCAASKPIKSTARNPMLRSTSASDLKVKKQLGPSSARDLKAKKQLGPSSASDLKVKKQLGPSSASDLKAKKQLGPSSARDLKTKKPIGPSSASDLKGKKTQVLPKKPPALPVASQARTSTRVTIKNQAQPSTTRRTTQVIRTTASQTRASTANGAQRKFEHVTMRRTTHFIHHKKPLETNAQQGPDLSGVQSKKRVTVGPIGNFSARQQPSIGGKYPKVNESAEERKTRLAEWRASKGKVMKRPPSSVVLLSTSKFQKDDAVIKEEPEEPRQLFWATMAEEDEQEFFTLKVNQVFGECQKLIDEGVPKEEILSVLEKQIEKIPEAKKLSRYWECLARLEQRDGHPYKVIEVCEEAVTAGAQPLEELRAILANTLEQLKTETGEDQKEEFEDETRAEELKTEVKPEAEDSAVKEKTKKGRRRAMKYEPKSPSTPEKSSMGQTSPEIIEEKSSVIRFNITTTPHLEKMRKLQMKEGESSIKGYKFLTPVRRSSRLERKSHIFPDMLKDHDPCIAGIAQLEDLEDPQSCPNAYIFRKNEALKEINAGSLTKN